MIYTGDPKPPIPPRVMATSAMWLKFGFLPTKHAKTNTIQNASMIFASHVTFYYLYIFFYLYAKTPVGADDIRIWRTMVDLITGKTQRPPIWAPCRNQDGAGSGISRVYLWLNLLLNTTCISCMWCTPTKQGTSEILGKMSFGIIVRSTLSALIFDVKFKFILLLLRYDHLCIDCKRFLWKCYYEK